jgi:threonine dehydratase
MGLEFADITAARERIRSHVLESPCPESAALSAATDMRVFCKLEHLQRTGSFKERGARNALMTLPPEQRARGVIAASAGNHALGLAYHAQLLGIPATVIMPRFAPLTKVVNCRRLGAKVVLSGNNIGEARAEADQVAAAEGLAYINGFDDAAIIAGQGTMGIELVEQVKGVDAILIPIGGAGLIAGVALAAKTLMPSVQIIGVEPERAACYTAALEAGKPVPIAVLPTLADGLAVPMVGPRAFSIARPLVDHVVRVSEHDIARAILKLMELEKAVVEGAGAAPLAACLANLCPELKGATVVFPLSGGNIDLTTLGRVIERGLASDGRLCRFTASISDRPGGLAKFASLLAEEGASIVDIHHDRAFASDDITRVTVHCVVETRDAEHVAQILGHLEQEGFEVTARGDSPTPHELKSRVL